MKKSPLAAAFESVIVTGLAALVSSAPTYLGHLPWYDGLILMTVVAPALRALQAHLKG